MRLIFVSLLLTEDGVSRAPICATATCTEHKGK